MSRLDFDFKEDRINWYNNTNNAVYLVHVRVRVGWGLRRYDAGHYIIEHNCLNLMLSHGDLATSR